MAGNNEALAWMDGDTEVGNWPDSPIPLFIAYFKRSIRYKGEYGFSWHQKGGYLFNHTFGSEGFDSAYEEGNCHSSVPSVKYEYAERNDIEGDEEYRVPIITFYPETQNISLDILLHFSKLPVGARKREEIVYWETFRNKRLFLKSSDPGTITFEKSEISLADYSDPNLYFEAVLYNNNVRCRNLNNESGVLYIQDVVLNLSGPINSDAEIWLEDADGNILGVASIVANNSVLELPVQFVIPYRKDKRECELNAVISRIALEFSDADAMLNTLNNNLFCQSLVRLKHANPDKSFIPLELRPSTDYISSGDEVSVPDYEERRAFSEAIPVDGQCDYNKIRLYLESELGKTHFSNPEVFTVFLGPYLYTGTNSNAGGSSPVLYRGGAYITLSFVNSYRIIAHELGHAMGLHHSNEDKAAFYDDLIPKVEKPRNNNIATLNQISIRQDAQANETEYAYIRRKHAVLSQKRNLTERERKHKQDCADSILSFENLERRIAEQTARIEKLTEAKRLDKYTINDKENVMQQNPGETDSIVLHPWQTKVIKLCN